MTNEIAITLVYYKMVSPSYFRTLGMRLLKGRGLAETDTKGAAPAIVVNETMVKKYFKARSPSASVS